MTPVVLGACLLLAAAAALLVSPRPSLAPVDGGTRGAAVAWWWIGPPVVALLVVGDAHTVSLGLVACGVALGARWLVVRRRAAVSAERAALRATEFCDAVAAELVAGGAPHQALASAADDLAEFVPVATAGQLGGDVPAALRLMAGRPGLDDLRLVAAAWQVSHRSGAGLADALTRVGDTLRARRRVGRMVAAELAAARATARIMAALPVVFVLAGSGLGADPLGFLLGGTAGVSCLATGLALTWAGLAWLQRIADAVAAG